MESVQLRWPASLWPGTIPVSGSAPLDCRGGRRQRLGLGPEVPIVKAGFSGRYWCLCFTDDGQPAGDGCDNRLGGFHWVFLFQIQSSSLFQPDLRAVGILFLPTTGQDD